MPLVDRTGAKDDLWTRDETAGHALLTLDVLPDALAARRNEQRLGVEIDNTVRAEELRAHLGQLALIAIRFPSFADGRGFSLARQLRRDGFAGTLRAVGPLIADQFAHALSCGFDEIELPDASASRQPAEQWLRAASIVSRGYQRGYAAPASILDRRRAARAAGAGHA